MDLTTLDASELARAIRDGETTALAAVQAVCARIDRLHPAINAVVTWDERSEERAREADAARARGEPLGPLHGVPVTIKDTIETAGLRTTAGAPPLANHVPARDAPAVARLRAAGAIVAGKTNTPTFAARPQTDNPIFGRTNNPWDVTRTPGGSSGGSCAAVASGMSFLDLGSDMSGSIRFPAAFCGVYGLRPTARRVPVVGHIPDPPGGARTDRHLATLGPIARSVRDLALALRALVTDDRDPRDTEVAPVPWRDAHVPAPRLAWAATLPGVPVAAAIRARVAEVAARLGAVSALPDGLTAHREPWLDHFAAFLHGAKELYPEVPFATERPAPTLGGVMRTLAARDRIIATWEAFFAEHDALLLPVCPVVAFPHCPPGTPLDVDGTPVESWRIDHLLYPFSFTGHPTVVLPAGRGADGLPIGIQLVGRRWGDERLLAIAEHVDRIVGGYAPPPLHDLVAT